MKSEIVENVAKRQKDFQPNPKLDRMIQELRQTLEPVQEAYNLLHSAPAYPIVGVIGLSRSGTTLVSQLLASTQRFAYPTNLMTRFAYSSRIGAMIQEILFNKDLDFRRELEDMQSGVQMNSWQGKTSGALGINEFFHFWRRFFPNHEPQYLTNEELGQVDIAKMCSEIAGIQNVFRKPFLAKAKMMQANASYFAQQLPNLVLIHVYREPRYVMQSLLVSRRAYYGRGNERIWWGSKPKNHEDLQKLNEYEQIAGQAYFIQGEIRQELEKIESTRKLEISYEDLCLHPRDTLGLVLSTAFQSDTRDNKEILDNLSLGSIKSGNTDKLPRVEIDRLMTAYKKFASDA